MSYTYIPASVISAFLKNVCPRGRYVADCAGCLHWSEAAAHCQHPQHPQYATEEELSTLWDRKAEARMDMAEAEREAEE